MNRARDAGPREMLAHGVCDLGIRPDPSLEDQFSLYLDLLQHWGGKMNLTARLEAHHIVAYHFLDSLSALPYIMAGKPGPLVDIGSGAGFPALPLKICMPELEVLLIESSHKKVSFCREVIRRLGLHGVTVRRGRAEKLGSSEDLSQRFAWAVARAVGRADLLVAICLPYLEPGGTLLLYKGILDEAETHTLEREITRQGATFEIVPVQVPYLEAPRNLVAVRKRST